MIPYDNDYLDNAGFVNRWAKAFSWAMFVLLIFLLGKGIQTAQASPEEEANVNQVLNAGDTMANSNSSISGSRSYGIGMGDVDIAQCYRSYQLLIWQDSKINPICLADSYDNKGLYAMAAMIRCDIKTIRKHFETAQQCIAANTVVFHVKPQATPMEDHVEDEDDRRYHELQQQLAALVEDRDQKEAQAARYAAQRRQNDKEDREYAQQLIEQIQQIEEPPSEH